MDFKVGDKIQLIQKSNRTKNNWFNQFKGCECVIEFIEKHGWDCKVKNLTTDELVSMRLLSIKRNFELAGVK